MKLCFSLFLILVLIQCFVSTFAFICPEDNGFFRDPEDDHCFYECINGKEFHFKCPPSLVFNESIKKCDYTIGPNVHPTTESHNGTQPTRHHDDHESSITSSPTTDAPHGTRPRHHTKTPKPMPTTPSPPPTKPSTFHCEKGQSGFYPDPDNKHWFFECANGKAYHFECPPGLVFSVTEKTCDYPKVSADNHPTTIRIHDDHSNNTTTPMPTTKTRPTTKWPFDCSKRDNGLYPDPKDEHCFYECSNGFTNHFTCPEDLVFNPAKKICDFKKKFPEIQDSLNVDSDNTTTPMPTTKARPTTKWPFDCSKRDNGLYPDPKDEHCFYECSNGFTNHFTCPEDLVFNPAKKICDFKHKTDDEMLITMTEHKQQQHKHRHHHGEKGYRRHRHQRHHRHPRHH